MGDNSLQTARYDNLLRRSGGLLGPGAKVTETLTELFPTFDTENLPAELMFLGGWILGMGTQFRAATVGQTSRVQVFNPLGSGKIAVLTDVFLQGTQDNINWEVNETAFGTLVTGTTRDTHAGFDVGTALATGNLATGNTPAAGRLFIETNLIFHFHMDRAIAVLRPGSGVEFGTVADNITLHATFMWRERIALDSELNFP